jgi:hypothetical protein
MTTCTGKENMMTDHQVVSREDWAAAREELLVREKEHTAWVTSWQGSGASCLGFASRRSTASRPTTARAR